MTALDQIPASVPARLLVVDDSFESRDMLARRLRRRGYAVAEAASAPEALRIVERAPPDLALFDYMMPDMSGLDALRILRRTKSRSELPVIMVTARLDQDSIVEALNSGANDYLGKPVEVMVAVARIEAQLERRRATLALRGMNARLEALVIERTAALSAVNEELRREIAARAQAERDLRDAKARAEAGSAAKTRFLANMSHELRTPLNAVIGFAEILSDQAAMNPAMSAQREYSEAILESGRQLLGLINSVIHFVRVDSATEPLQEVETDLGGFLADMARAATPAAMRAGVEIRAHLAEGIPRVRADVRLLAEAVGKLIDNAVKFTPAGGEVRLWIGYAREGLEIRVEDDGPGVPPEAVEQLMAPFSLGDESYARTHSGLGLGLPTARRILERHGGMLTIGRRENGGGVARAILPMDRLAPGESAA